MAIMSSHGGSCCGMKHINTFRSDPETNVRELIRHTGARLYGDGNYQLEVILSDRQTRENPGLIAELARLGYVYTSSWTGQHETPIHLFLRAKHRLALSAANFYGRWTGALNGMLPHPSLSGTLPALDENTLAAGAVFIRGARVRNKMPGSPRNSYVGVIETTDDHGGGQVRYAYDNRLIFYGYLSNSFEIVERAAAAAPPTVYRHPQNPAGWPEPVASVAAPERRLILSQFYCVFRTTGQASRVFVTLAEAQATYPQALDWHERKVYSDGEIVEEPVNHG